MKTISLSPVFDLGPLRPAGHTLQHGSAGANSELFFLLVPSSAGPIPTSPVVPQILALWPDLEEYTATLEKLEPVQSRLHFVQATPDGWLLVHGRTRMHKDGTSDPNGFFFSATGQLQRTVSFGDAIEEVMVTGDGTIWTSYFDESACITGVGLVAWNPNGTERYSFQKTAALEPIDDCYALNVASDLDTWFYYYSPFHLVHLHDYQVAAHWEMPIAGTKCFAVNEQHALFVDGYSRQNRLHLFELEAEGRVRAVETFEPLDENGESLQTGARFARGERLYFLKNERLYQITISELLKPSR